MLNSQIPYLKKKKKPTGMAADTCNPRAEGVEPGRFLELASQPVL